MKNSILVVMLAVFIAACGGGAASGDKKAELEKLKKQKSELEVKIASLEEEIAKTDTTAAAKGKATEVITMELKPQTFKTYIEVQGRVDADENVTLSTEIPGTITKINVKVGDHVGKGQVLAETDVRATQQQLAAMQASMALVNQTYEKQKNLWEQKIGTEIAFLQIKTGKEALEASIAAMQEQIRMSKIISPIDGTVDMVNIKVGQAASPGAQAITVVNFSNLKVKAEVAESYAARVKNDNEVIVLFPDTKDTVVGKVHYASRAINALTRTFGVEVLLDGKKEYHPNQVAKIRINDYQSPSPVIVVPVKYIQKSENGSFVMVDENGKAVKRTVTLGREYSGNAEVLSGLKEGDQVITEGYDMVNEGGSVKAIKE